MYWRPWLRRLVEQGMAARAIVARGFFTLAANPVFFGLVARVFGILDVRSILKCTKRPSLRFRSNIDNIYREFVLGV